MVLTASATVQGILFAYLTPLLPALQRDLDLSKGEIGILVGAFPVGQGAAAIPVAIWSTRASVGRLLIVGMALMGITTLAFVAADTTATLTATRVLQGAAAGTCFAAGFAWVAVATVPSSRARAVGTLSGGAAAGHVIGPLAGAAALDVGRLPTLGAVSLLAIVLAVVTAALPAPRAVPTRRLASIRKLNGSRAIVCSLWVVALGALVVGMLFALAPLQLSHVGASPNAIALTFMLAAGVGVVARPIAGVWADRRGVLSGLMHLLAVMALLCAAIAVVDSPVVLHILILVAVAVGGAVFGPAMALTASSYEAAGVSLVVAFSAMALVVGAALFAGAAAAGVLAGQVGDPVPYFASAAILGSTALGLARTDRRAVRAGQANSRRDTHPSPWTTKASTPEDPGSG